jgi:hypothetical protein
MKFFLPVLAASLLAASCTESLEKVSDTRRQQRIDRANADLPLASGASDGLGSFISKKYEPATTASKPADAKQYP